MYEFTAREWYQASRARDLASAYYLSNPRVTLIDVGYAISDGAYTGELAVRVHVRQKPTGAVAEAMSTHKPDLYIQKERIPFKADIIEGSYPLQSHWWQPSPAEPRAQLFDPLRGGIGISTEWFYGYGTLGGIVRDRETAALMILSNWHVLAGSFYARPGSRIVQPAAGDGGSRSHTIARLTRHVMAQGIDAAVAQLEGNRQWLNDQLNVGTVTGVATPQLGMRTVKSGRASRVTYGIVDGVNGEYSIRYGSLLRKIRHVCRIVPQPEKSATISQGGDSGSWHLEEETNRAVGLHFAGTDTPESALAIDMPHVLDALNVDVAMTTAVPERAAIRHADPVF